MADLLLQAIGREGAGGEEDEGRLAAMMKGLDQQKEVNKANFVPKTMPEPSGSRQERNDIDGGPNPRGSRPPPTTMRNAKTGGEAMAVIREQTARAHQERFGIKNKYIMDTSKLKPKSAAELVQQQQRTVIRTLHCFTLGS